MSNLTLYFDRCFGTRFPDALRKARPPFNVEFHHDRRGQFKFKQDMPDDQWLAVAGQKDWIVFSHDRKFHKEESECFAIKQHNIGCFYLWGSQAQTWEKFRSFMRGYDRMIDIIASSPRPFIYDVSELGRIKKIDIP